MTKTPVPITALKIPQPVSRSNLLPDYVQRAADISRVGRLTSEALAVIHETDLAKAKIKALEAQLQTAREALEIMVHEYGDDHYHTCPAANDSGPCNCYGGIINSRAKEALRSLTDKGDGK